jgi:carboxylesterase
MQDKILTGCEPIYLIGDERGCLLLHGFTSSPFELRLLGDHLNKKGYTVSIPLLPGHGTSPQDMRKRSWGDWYEKAKSELFNLRKTCKKVYVIGLSMGGSLALHLAAHYEVNGIVAMAPGLYLKNKMTILSHFISLLYPYTKKGAGADIRANEVTKSYDKIPLKSLSELLKFFKHFRNDLVDIYSPLLIIHALQDHVIDAKSVEYIYNKTSSKKKRVLKLYESYHIVTLDVEREKVFNEIEKFLADLV